MSEVKVWGSSDDLIEVDGAIVEEFSAFNEDESFLAFSDGTVLRITYNDDGEWIIRRHAVGTAQFVHIPFPNEQSDYTDVATLTGDNLAWCVMGRRFVNANAKVVR